MITVATTIDYDLEQKLLELSKKLRLPKSRIIEKSLNFIALCDNEMPTYMIFFLMFANHEYISKLMKSMTEFYMNEVVAKELDS